MLHSFMVNLTQTKVIQEEGTSTKEMFKCWAVVAHTLNSSTQEKLFSFLSVNVLPACMHVHCVCWYMQRSEEDMSNCSSGWLLITMWSLGTEPRFSARAAHALNL